MLFSNERESTEELEALQTDIMRFFAIIAFCLLVIFIPLAKEMPDTPPPSPSAENAQYYKEKFDQLSQELKELAKKVQSTQKLKQQIQQLQQQVKQAQQKLQQEKSKIQAVTQARIKYKEIKNKTQKIKTKITKTVTKKTTKEIPKKAQTTEKQNNKPKNIIFASPLDLIELMQSGDVEFYIFASQKLFQAKAQGVDVSFDTVTKVDFSQRSFVMPKENVPSKIRKTFLRYYANLVNDSTEYYLRFSEALHVKLFDTMKNHQGGDYVISSDLDINYRP